jgi:hypothetical protein
LCRFSDAGKLSCVKPTPLPRLTHRRGRLRGWGERTRTARCGCGAGEGRHGRNEAGRQGLPLKAVSGFLGHSVSRPFIPHNSDFGVVRGAGTNAARYQADDDGPRSPVPALRAKTHEEGQLVCFQGNLLMSRLPSFSADDIRGKGRPLCQARPVSFACSN